MELPEKNELYDIYARAQLIRENTECTENFTILVQKTARHVSAHNILEHVFTAEESEITESEEIYLGWFEKNHDKITVCFRNDCDGEDRLYEEVHVPVICMYDKCESEMSLCIEGVRAKVVLSIKPHVKEPPLMTTTARPAKFVPSTSAYRLVRSFVVAVANVKSRVDHTAQALVGTVSFVVEGTKFVCTMSYDLTRDFLVNLDLLFSEGCLAVDESLDSTRTLLAESLSNLSQQLQLRLMTADHILTQKIVAVLQRLHPYINSLTRMAYPYVSMALFLSKPLRTVLYPYVEPTINRALGLHDRLQKSMIVGPIVASATEKALIVYQNTANIYQALEEENKNKWD